MVAEGLSPPQWPPGRTQDRDGAAGSRALPRAADRARRPRHALAEPDAGGAVEPAARLPRLGAPAHGAVAGGAHVVADLFLGTGRRKRSVACVSLTLGSGQIIINNKSLEEYFTRPVLQQIVRQP